MSDNSEGTVGPTFVSSDPANEIAADAPLTAGTKVGEYVVEAVLGQGAFGTVYRGVQPVIGKQVAIKVLSLRYSVDPKIVSRFVSEARAVNQIRHENIIDIFSFGALPDGRRYYVMAYVDGVPLDIHLDRVGRLDLDEALSILGPIADALDAAHKNGIAHRDLKPANIFLGQKSDGTWFPKLLDFGIAKLMGDDLPKNHQTATGAAVGTPHYMAPEQCMGEDIDHRADIYAFGVVMFRMLLGRLPFVADSTIEVLVQHMNKAPPAPRSLRPDLDESVETIILQLLEKNRENRPAQLAPVIRALKSGDPTTSGAIRTPPTAPKFDDVQPRMMNAAGLTLPIEDTAHPDRNRSRPLLIAAVAIGLAAVTALVILGRAEQPSTPAEDVHRAAIVPVEPRPAADSAPSPDITLTIDGAPKGAVVRTADGSILGPADEPIVVPRGSDAIDLIVAAEGFVEAKVRLVPEDDKSVVVALVEAPKKKRRRRVKPKTTPTAKRAVDADAMDTWE